MFDGINYVPYVFNENVAIDKKFIYHHAHADLLLATLNIMSYSGHARKYTWHWQWVKANNNIH
ncbi:hypothetical protein [Chryseobacterium sp. CY350]|uniref:hypothetical protein n=1 Tax=Chryseobacterium sp. CY350 TaxID=2997336 RepID=UPI00226D88D4|nr:hypothetical protein [Chryseobacterium sp. CY350]